jgi:hypothetical protein
MPKATFEEENKLWSLILGKGRRDEVDWANGVENMLELDLFDFSDVAPIINQIKREMNLERIGRLKFIASFRTWPLIL